MELFTLVGMVVVAALAAIGLAVIVGAVLDGMGIL
jgi:hypothetical protein